MKLETFSYSRDEGWSVEAFPALNSEQTLVLVFGASCYLEHTAPVEALVAAYPDAQIIGCSTAGEIFDTTISDESLSVAVLEFGHTRVATAHAKVAAIQESYQAGKTLADGLQAPDLKAVLVLSNGTTINGSELVRGLNERLSPNIVVTGGLAGDGDRFERTWVLHEGQMEEDYVCAAGLYGEHIRVGHGSKGGWDAFGPQRRITRSSGSVLYELDGKPALDLYKEYLGELAAELPSSALLFPLALSSEQGTEERVVRTILSVDEDAKSLTFAGDVPNDTFAQLMKANFDRLIDGANEAAIMTKTARNGGASVEVPMLSIAISCVGRRLVLGERSEEELEATMEVLPKATKQVGFYSYGEISPYANGSCELHNQTMTLTTIREE